MSEKENLIIEDMDLPLKKLSGIACALSGSVDAAFTQDGAVGVGFILEEISSELNKIYSAVTG